MENISKYLQIPHNCYVILTAKCNLRCLHCYGDFGTISPQKELTGKQWIKIFKDLANNKVFYLNISGGEPTLHPDFEIIINSLVKNKIFFLLTTNGLVEDSKLKAIIRAKDNIIGIQVSLDGPDWKSHGFIRKDVLDNSSEHNYQKTIDTIQKLIKTGIRVSIATCIHKDNIHQINLLKKLIIKLKPVNWSLSSISLSGLSSTLFLKRRV